MSKKPLKFPEPKDYAAKDPVILCPADRVVRLYNEANIKTAKRIAKQMKEWFAAEATKKGWASCSFPPVVQSKHGGGAILLNPSSVKITVQQIIIQRPK